VFIDFTAAYCMVCKTNEMTVLNTDEVQNAFRDKGVFMLKGDYTRRNEVIYEWLKRYGRAGVPLYLLFVPGREEPVVFPEVITKGMVLGALEGI
jgi:thiol:disulfide interchange protein DsbD